MTTALLEDRPREALWNGPVIDCDVHAVVPSIEALLPYQDRIWVEATRERGWAGPAGVNIAYPKGAPTTAREAWRRPGKVPASELSMLQEDVLDPWGTERAIVNCYYAVSSLRHPDWAIALARSVNDWLAAEWLDRDPRLRGSLVVPARDPVAAAAEIDRAARHQGFVQVLLPVRSERLWGQRVFWPVWEAIERNDLVAGIHWGGTPEDGPGPSGYPAWYAEEYAAETQVYASQLTSLIVEGVFQKFPKLRVSVLESGFAWVPTWMWNVNKKWKGLRREIPWVNRLPSEILRDHVRFSIAPLDMGPPAHMRRIVDWLGSEDMLMFATDYPHLHNGDLGAFLDLLPETMRPRVMAETARAWYRL